MFPSARVWKRLRHLQSQLANQNPCVLIGSQNIFIFIASEERDLSDGTATKYSDDACTDLLLHMYVTTCVCAMV